MDAQVALLLVWTGLVLLTAELKRIDAAEIYTNTWAVQINGGLEEADRIAKEHGFINQGNVSSTCILFIAIAPAECILYYIDLLAILSFKIGI